MIIQNEHNACLIHQNYLVATSSSPGQKLQTALHLFNYLIYWNLISLDILIVPEFQVMGKNLFLCLFSIFECILCRKIKTKIFRQRSFRVVRGLFERSEVSLRSFLAY